MRIGRGIALGTLAATTALLANVVASSRAPVERDGQPEPVGTIVGAALLLMAGAGAVGGARLLGTGRLAPRAALLGGWAGGALLGAGAGLVAAATPVGQFLAGGTMSLVNAGTSLVRLPSPSSNGQRYWYQGSVAEPAGRAQQAGARVVDDLLQGVGIVRDAHTGDAMGGGDRVGRRTIEVDHERADAPWVLAFEADAPGADWGVVGREAAMLRVFVDGAHHSDVIVHAERDEPFEVDLGVLGEGSHEIELRRPSDELVAAERPHAVLASTLRARALDGDAAVIARHAPIIEGRDLGLPGGTPSELSTDAPIAVIPQVERDGEGRIREITYRTMYTGEDGGTHPADAQALYGRTVDMELAYQVRLDASGRVVEESFGGPMHRVQRFTGEHEGDRPLLRVATSNNNYSQQLRGSGARWSLAPEAPATIGIRTLAREHAAATPWIAVVAAKEVQRER